MVPRPVVGGLDASVQSAYACCPAIRCSLCCARQHRLACGLLLLRLRGVRLSWPHTPTRPHHQLHPSMTQPLAAHPAPVINQPQIEVVHSGVQYTGDDKKPLIYTTTIPYTFTYTQVSTARPCHALPAPAFLPFCFCCSARGHARMSLTHLPKAPNARLAIG